MKDKNYYASFHPKPRTGKECKKVNCERHKSYVEWKCGNSDLKFCMDCKHSHVSQYIKIVTT